MKMWFDILNPSHVHVMCPLIENYREKNEIIITARDFVETFKLLKLYDLKFTPYGAHGGKSWLKKRTNAIKMILELRKLVGDFDINLSMGSHTSPFIVRSRHKKAVAITDNDHSFALSRILSMVVDHYILPRYIEPAVSKRILRKTIFFNGFKEELYISDYKFSNKVIREAIPFKEYVVLRGEHLQSHYVPKNAKIMFPAVAKSLIEHDINVVFVPRFSEERGLLPRDDRIYCLEESINGLDLLYYSNGVATGSGSFAREGAVIGVPAASFYPGEKLLTVDREMIKQRKIIHSRDEKEIVKHLINNKKIKIDYKELKKVKTEVIMIIDRIMDEIRK